MPTLEELLNSGLGNVLQQGGAPLEEDLYQRQAQAEQESTFGRGLGISSVTRDALAKARTDAAMSAQQAQLAALGQAAAVTQARDARTQQESQFSRTQDMQKRQMNQQQSMANQQLLASGLGAGVGALGQLAGSTFGPEIRGGLRGSVGLAPLRQDASGGGVPAGQMPSAAPMTMPTFDGAGSGGGPDLGGLADFQMPSQDFSFDMPDYNFDYGGFDLSGLFDSGAYDPYQWGGYM